MRGLPRVVLDLPATLRGMPITTVSGLDWATVMTAFGTAGAVIAAVGIAIGSSHGTKKLLRKQLEHSNQQLRKQQQYSDQQLQKERAAADERLQKQFHETEKLEQRSQAAAVEVLAFSAKPGENLTIDPQNPSGLPVVIVVNRGKYAITDIDVGLSLDGRSVIPFSPRQNPVSMRHNAVDPAALPEHWTRDRLGRLGEVYFGHHRTRCRNAVRGCLAAGQRPENELSHSSLA